MRALRLLAGTLLLLVLAACGGAGGEAAGGGAAQDAGGATSEAPAATEDDADAGDSGGESGGAAPDKVTFALGNDTKSTPIFVGHEKGIFLDHGIELDLQLLATGTEMSTMLQSGQAQFAAPAISNAPIAREQGIDEVAVVAVMNNPAVENFDEPVAIVATQASGIAEGDVEGLRGKRLGLAVGSTGDQYARAVLEANGVDPSEVQFVNLAGAGETTSAFRGGSVDAVATWEPQISELITKDGAVTVSRNGNFIDYVMLAYASRDVIDNNPDLVQRFVAAVAESAAYTRQNRDEAAAISARRLGADEEVVRAALDHEEYDPRISEHTEAAWLESVDLLIEQDKLDAKTERSSIEQSFNTTFIDKVVEEHPEFFEDLP